MSAFRPLKRITAGLLAVLGLAISSCGGGGGGGGGPPVPAIATISPVGTSAGNAAFTLTVLGSGFTQSSTVQWNGANRTTLFFSGSTLKAQISASDIATVGTATVVVNDTARGLSNSRTFTVAATTIAFQSTGELGGTNVPNLNSVQNIWTMDAGGTNAKPFTNLTFNAADNRSPVWSPDGSKIAYASERALDGSNNRDRQNHNIWVGNTDGSNQKALTPLTDGGAESFAPEWSPDGTQIAYVSARKLDGSDNFNPPSLTTNIWLMNADGTNQRHLTALTANEAGAASPVQWSPDSTRLVFPADSALDGSDNSNGTSHTRNLWIVRADGSGLVPLTKLTAFVAANGAPFWSPDGTKIGYLSLAKLDLSDAANTNLAQNIWVINPDGSNRTPLTQLTAVNVGIFSAIWSPDGSKIAFVSARPLNGDNTDVPNGTAQNVWVVNADGSNPTHVTAFTAMSIAISDLAWTAGGTKLLFSSNAAVGGGDALNTNSITNIFVMDADGGNRGPLTIYTATNTGASAPAQP